MFRAQKGSSLLNCTALYIDTAVDAVKKGAYDYISKPIDLNRLLVSVRNALEKGSLVNETKALKKKLLKADK